MGMTILLNQPGYFLLLSENVEVAKGVSWVFPEIDLSDVACALNA
jgi:hypothetical protein